MRAGYRTMAVGKWHLGHRSPFLPTENGFASYFGLLYSNDMRPPRTDVPLRLYRDDQALRRRGRSRHCSPSATPRRRCGSFANRATARSSSTSPTPCRTVRSMPPSVSPASRGAGSTATRSRPSTGAWARSCALCATPVSTRARWSSSPATTVRRSAAGWKAGRPVCCAPARASSYEGGMREPCIVRWPDADRAGAGARRRRQHARSLSHAARARGSRGRRPSRQLDGRSIVPLLEGRPLDDPTARSTTSRAAFSKRCARASGSSARPPPKGADAPMRRRSHAFLERTRSEGRSFTAAEVAGRRRGSRALRSRRRSVRARRTSPASIRRSSIGCASR